MLRITIHDNPGALTFQLEGKLAGPWVREAEECWRGNGAGQRGPDARVDLTGVTFIDAAGKAFLADAHAQGARLIASDCLTKAIVAEIIRDATPARGRAGTRTRDRVNEEPV